VLSNGEFNENKMKGMKRMEAFGKE